MDSIDRQRRQLLKLGGSLWGASLLNLKMSALTQAAVAARHAEQFRALPPTLAESLQAIAARILPSDDTPGASEAGAIWFIDTLVAEEMPELLEMLGEGVAALDELAGQRFTALSPQSQDALLTASQDSPFFQTMRMLTIAGTFAMQSRGGNRNNVGWQLLGFDQRHVWTPPFGFYDASENSKDAQ
jgi:gluconate 2-dehydrogenase gamma chain